MSIALKIGITLSVLSVLMGAYSMLALFFSSSISHESLMLVAFFVGFVAFAMSVGSNFQQRFYGYFGLCFNSIIFGVLFMVTFILHGNS